jgi:hypothetical protein
VITNQRDDALARLQSTAQQCELVQSQLRESQARYWEELKRVKDAEGQLVEEAEHLAQVHTVRIKVTTVSTY